MGYKKEVIIHSLDQLQVPKTLEKFIEELPERYVDGSINEEIEEQIDKDWNAFRIDVKKQKRTFGKKAVTFSLSLAAACVLFIGSTFVSPAMAKIASKIPYLNMLIESKPVIDEISEALDEKGYKWDGLGVVVQPKEVSVMIVGSDEYFNQVKLSVEELIRDILKSRNFDAYEIKVSRAPVIEEPTFDEKKEWEEYEKISDVVLEVLQKYGYNSLGQENGINNGLIEFELPKTETRTEDIKKQIVESLRQQQMGEFSIKVHTYDPYKREREDRWLPIVNTISDGLTAKPEYKVKMVGYSNKLIPFTISIKTNLSPTDPDVNDVVDKIEKTVQEFLDSEKAQHMIKEDQYEVIIYSEKREKLN
ncbi:DUF4030 domain-containing protein [Peribacillus sp. B-H-3]|uniref:DUF4030 domain-containing protein n=1 Tax=Peribacillus sp. B-H-3 TaxID=3400420 RepID=UPI003B01F37B